jgi:hypothetical protein
MAKKFTAVDDFNEDMKVDPIAVIPNTYKKAYARLASLTKPEEVEAQAQAMLPKEEDQEFVQNLRGYGTQSTPTTIKAQLPPQEEPIVEAPKPSFKSAMSSLESKLQPKPKATEASDKPMEEPKDTSLEEAIARRNALQDKAFVMDVFQNIGEGVGKIAGETNMEAGPRSMAAKAFEKEAGQQVSDAETIRKAKTEQAEEDRAATKFNLELGDATKSRDPSSDVSQLLRSGLKKLYPGVSSSIPNFDNLTADNINKVYPMVKDWAENQIRLDQARLLREARAEGIVDKEMAELHKELDPDQFRAGNFANNKKIYDRADRLMAMVKYKDPSELSEPQIFELARGLEGIISGGVGTITGAMHLMPKNLRTGIVGVQQWLSSKPEPAKLKEFATMLVDATVREQRAALTHIKDTQQKRLNSPKFRKLKEKRPEDYQSIAELWGFDAQGKPTSTVEEDVPSLIKAASASYPKRLSNGTHEVTVSNAQDEKEARSEGFK